MGLIPLLRSPRGQAVLLSLGLSFLLGFMVVQTLFAQDAVDQDRAMLEPNLSISKMVDESEALPGSTLLYTIVITNSGDSSASDVWLTDTLPVGLTYQDDFNSNIGGLFGYMDHVITWTGGINPSSQAMLTFSVVLTDSLMNGDILTNTVEVTGTGDLLTDYATTAVITHSEPITSYIYLPIVRKAPPIPTLNITPPNAANQWTVSWSNEGPSVTDYELQESQDPDFGTYTTYLLGTNTSLAFNHSPSVVPVYYYRVRAQGDWGAGPWSNVQSVTGASLTLTLNDIARPGSNNQWVISWSNGGANVTGYQLQESHTADFSSVTTYEFSGGTTAVQANHAAGFRNLYYYRVRANSLSGYSDWSNVESIIGAYHDNFNDHSSGWGIRRTTLIEDVQSWYEPYNNGQDNRLIIRIEDSWDWGITSPLMPAPSLPYVIEYRAEIANMGNLVSHGLVYGADWNGVPDACPDWSTIAGVYEHTACFNHFYNTNIIWHGPLTLLFERIDYLVWCPHCGGSPMKRLSDSFQPTTVPIPNVNSNGANTYRVEVRDSGSKLFANGTQYFSTSDTMWVTDPYFGIFASTDEYSNSTWRIEYFKVTPLDE